MAGLLNLMNEWLIRVVVLSSFAAHVVLVLFAGIRRRKAFSWRRPFLWLAYQVADWAATYALGNLSLGSTSREQQLVAFWAPFLLVHLGGPDNISAYSLEDNILSGRQVLNAGLQVVGASIVLYQHVYIGGSGTLLYATVIMFAVGVVKYFERSWALWKGNLDNIKSSGKKQKPRSFRPDQCGGRELDNEQALQVAHSLFHFCKGAFADYSDDKDPLKLDTSRKLFSSEWRHLRKVVEMELSLMYDILYTKAAVIHTRPGYIIRVLSPPFTAAAFLLFFFYSKDGQRRVDVVITYILLAATFLLDMTWLLRALGSTWTYAYLDARPRCWLHHAFLCTGRWHRLRRVVVYSLDPCRLHVKTPSSYRMWSGTIGQYNLFHECTHDTTGLCSRLVKKVASEDSWKEYQYHYSMGLDISADKVEEELFRTIRESLEKAYPVPVDGDKAGCPCPCYPDPCPCYPDPCPSPCPCPCPCCPCYQCPCPCHAWLPPAEIMSRRKLDEALNFGPEFQEVILIWHIATDVFLLCSDQNVASPKYVKKAIKALSDYMVFLVAVRPYMLSGLKLQSLYRATRDALDEIWRSRISPGSTTREKELASILRNMEKKGSSNTPSRSVLYDSSIILSDGTKYAEVLLTLLRTRRWVCDINPEDKSKERVERLQKIFEEFIPALMAERDSEKDKQVLEFEGDIGKMLGLILEAWVRLLIYVSVRCSRDSHAKQLSRGGELTTIVWILAEHAGIFGIDK